MTYIDCILVAHMSAVCKYSLSVKHKTVFDITDTVLCSDGLNAIAISALIREFI